MTKDPVCGMSVHENDNSEKSILDNKVYYFCSSLCKVLFEESPKQYLEKDDKETITIVEQNQIHN